MRRVIALILFLGVIFASYAEAEEWYKLKEDEIYITDFLLQAEESKEINIDFTHPVKIGFKTDASSYELQKELSNKYGKKIIGFADITDGSNGISMSTVWAGAIECKPIENKIVVKVTNLIDKDFKIVIYKKELDPAD